MEEAGAAGILSCGLRADPGLQLGGRGDIEQPCKKFQVNALMFESKGKVPRQGCSRTGCGGYCSWT